ncbi:Peptide-N4-(N-acetyl-beta-glucosaminyl)asparagine amidase A [Pleurotus pulmonarius]
MLAGPLSVLLALAVPLAQATVLRNFQVAQPVPLPQDVKSCTIQVLQRDFAFSFGLAEVVQLVPPTHCGLPGTWSAITLNFTVTSNGTQFDRLGIFTFQNVEIWRTSTPEPVRGDGIIWTYIKDVTHYAPLFRKPGTFILQLDNLIQDNLDGVYSTVLHATFYAPTTNNQRQKADMIIPLSTMRNDTGNDASVPPGFSTTVAVPTNTVNLFAELYASGNGQEESWYFNVPNRFFSNIPPDITFGNGPFREVRLLVDGRVAGVAFPYATIFTGGFVPSVWRPISAYGALDLPTYFIDVTPFVPLLVDGKPHNFTIDVASAEADHSILQNWFVSGALYVATDSSTRPTTGKIVSYDVSPFAQSTTKGNIGDIGEVEFSLEASRRLRIESEVVSGSGAKSHVVWSQSLAFSNSQTYRVNGTVQSLRQSSTGRTTSSHNGVLVVSDVFSYPLDINFKYLTPDLQHWNFSIDHTYDRSVSPNPFMITSKIHSQQEGAGFYNLAPTGNFGNGTNFNNFAYEDADRNTYTREVNAAFNNITLDRIGGSLASIATAGNEFAELANCPLEQWKVKSTWSCFSRPQLHLPSPLCTVLVDFQVANPPPVPQDTKQCTIQILQRDFAFSFGLSEIVQYAPPTECGEPGSWAGITLNFTVTSNGTQFDRLGIFTFQNVEIWRTSTPEPTRGDGIIWTYVKDVTRYTPLFAKNGTFILQLDNLIQTGLDGVYSTVLHATFHASSPTHPPAPQANTIIPLSTLANDTGNDASVPPGFSINVTLPRNAVEVYAELYASGNGNEEFWYFNVPNQFLPDLPAGFALGQGPFREVRLLVDGQVAGVAFPYATIFTGGIVPTAWRPITSYGAIDLPTYFLDLTPFVPILSDGQPHNITIDVASADPNRTTLQNWFVSGLLQVVTDSSSKPTTGHITSYSAQPFAEVSNDASIASNGDTVITVKATRKVHIEADVISGSGKTKHVVFSQDLSYSNVQTYLNDFNIQNVFQTATGVVVSTHNQVQKVVDTFSYPLGINITNITPDGRSFKSVFDHSYNRVLLPAPFILGSTIREHQLADGFFNVAPTGNTGNGTSQNQLSYVDLAGNTYNREVNAALNVITLDKQSGSLAPVQLTTLQKATVSPKEATFGSVRLPGGKRFGV